MISVKTEKSLTPVRADEPHFDILPASDNNFMQQARIVIATSGFTNSAEKLADANDIKLIHHSQIKTL